MQGTHTPVYDMKNCIGLQECSRMMGPGWRSCAATQRRKATSSASSPGATANPWSTYPPARASTSALSSCSTTSEAPSLVRFLPLPLGLAEIVLLNRHRALEVELWRAASTGHGYLGFRKSLWTSCLF